MYSKKLKIIILLDTPKEFENSPQELLQNPSWQDEKDVLHVLKKLGHKVILQGIFSSIEQFSKKVQEHKPDLIFNMCESFFDNRNHEPLIAGLCEMLFVPYTGSCPYSLMICRDKGLQKKILKYHKISTPDFLEISQKQKPPKKVSLSLPSIVKPLNGDASEGMTQKSFVKKNLERRKQINFIHTHYDCDLLVEEYVPGQDLYVGVLGDSKTTVFPPVEMIYKKYPKDKANIATLNAKWNLAYRKKWGISVQPYSGKTQKIQSYSRNIFRTLKLSGYCRFDLRMTLDGNIFFVEANPNPSIAKNDEFALGAKLAGISYDNLIKKIIALSFKKNKQ
jgi:D-alanine-D-alanine ligase